MSYREYHKEVRCWWWRGNGSESSGSPGMVESGATSTALAFSVGTICGIPRECENRRTSRRNLLLIPKMHTLKLTELQRAVESRVSQVKGLPSHSFPTLRVRGSPEARVFGHSGPKLLAVLEGCWRKRGWSSRALSLSSLPVRPPLSNRG